MICPRCNAWTSVLDTRSNKHTIRRRRECANEHRFTTTEVVADQSLGEFSQVPPTNVAERHERDAAIVTQHAQGVDPAALAVRWGVRRGAINAVLKRAGIDIAA